MVLVGALTARGLQRRERRKDSHAPVANPEHMTEHEVSRTLVKSPPELWAQCSQVELLTRHLDQFGEIHITRLEPETTVAWEGEDVRGTVRLEPSGWGTKVILTARHPSPVPALSEPLSEPLSNPEPAALTRRGWFARLLVRMGVRSEVTLELEEPTLAQPPEIEPPATPDEEALTAALDSLGAAHHRPFSRA